MTVSSIPNYIPCWNCNADVNQHGGAYCEEFDAYHCNMCDNADGIECVICASEQIETTHAYCPTGALSLTTDYLQDTIIPLAERIDWNEEMDIEYHKMQILHTIVPNDRNVQEWIYNRAQQFMERCLV